MKQEWDEVGGRGRGCSRTAGKRGGVHEGLATERERQRPGQIPEPLGRQTWQEVVTGEQERKTG